MCCCLFQTVLTGSLTMKYLLYTLLTYQLYHSLSLLSSIGSIVNGFALPLKKEHVHFLHKALIPLHKPKCIALYHQQLVYCVTQYMEKDKTMCEPIVRGLIRFWPWTSTNKVVLFIHELEEILELAHPGEKGRIWNLSFIIFFLFLYFFYFNFLQGGRQCCWC